MGYRELFEHFDGRITLPAAIDLIKQHTRNYAKRQLTWLRRDKSWQWVVPDAAVMIALVEEGAARAHPSIG